MPETPNDHPTLARDAYAGDTPPPWDIGRPQRAIAELAARVQLGPTVLDVGCGTGENSLLLAGLGLTVTGIDPSEVAIDRARAKAQTRELSASFVLGNGLELAAIDGQFDTVIDSGVFHIFSDQNRPRYVANLADKTRSGGLYVCLIFSDREPDGWGPRRVRRDELEASFSPASGFQILSIEESLYENTHKPPGARAWLMFARRL